MSFVKHTWHCEAINERVPCKAACAATNRAMIYNLALSILTTSVITRIYTFLVHTCTVRSALGIYQALRSTVWWSSNKLG